MVRQIMDQNRTHRIRLENIHINNCSNWTLERHAGKCKPEGLGKEILPVLVQMGHPDVELVQFWSIFRALHLHFQKQFFLKDKLENLCKH